MLKFKCNSHGKEAVKSQIVACRTDRGVILAADSKVFDVNPKNEITEVKINRMLQLTSDTAIVTGGAAEGEMMCRNLNEIYGPFSYAVIDRDGFKKMDTKS